MKQGAIKDLLENWNKFDFFNTSTQLLNILGYKSRRTLPGQTDLVEDFIELFSNPDNETGTYQELRTNVSRIRFLTQFTDEDVSSKVDQTTSTNFLLDNEESREKSFLFVAAELEDEHYSRTKYAQITREINKLLGLAPTIVFLKTKSPQSKFTISTVYRREHKKNQSRNVLGKVSLIKEINPTEPHRAHLDILSELSLDNCLSLMNSQKKSINFDNLLNTWLGLLSTDKLNKNFYKELYNWFERAVKETTFPSNSINVLSNEEHIIRLITRLLFVWFIKEKELVSKELFIEEHIKQLLLNYNPISGDSYYRVVLQNLFFATLNTEIQNRGFKKGKQDSKQHPSSSQYKYEEEIRNKEKLLSCFAETPFINGGLFDCLDRKEANSGEVQLIDCFSNNHVEQLSIPNRLFFDNGGIFSLLNRYKFTVEERTPVEQEVALDPELLGKVFENLLAAYNPETKETVRKKTGSYYTPNEVVDFMVGETLVEALSKKTAPNDNDIDFWKDRLHYLLDYEDEFSDAEDLFEENEKVNLVSAIAELKIIDPAVGSGAFLIGVLHRLILVLSRLDPKNVYWKELQINSAGDKTRYAFENTNKVKRDKELKTIGDIFQKYSGDFGRKLFLIQNSIFGVDIQPIACQIAKLRFFISLAIDQHRDYNSKNFGIRPLPNLETRFVAADTLMKEKSLWYNMLGIGDWLRKLTRNREKYFHATSYNEKNSFKLLDLDLRSQFSELTSLEDTASVIANWDPFDQNSKADWFDPRYMFGIEEGFDIVIGNPPYIRLQNDGGKLGTRYQHIAYQVFEKKGDIYSLFYERGLQLLNNGGCLCYITSNKWMKTEYGRSLREFFTTQNPVKLIDFGGSKIFENVSVDSNILLIKKERGNSTVPAVKINENYGAIKYFRECLEYTEIDVDEGPWRIYNKTEASLLNKIEQIGTPLKEWPDISIYRGVLTGCNEAFIIDNETKEALVKEDPMSGEILKPILRGRDIKRYNAEWVGLWLIDSHNGYKNNPPIDIDDYPAIKRHLDKFYPKLEKRADKGNTPYNLRNCAYHALLEQEKIVWPDITSSPNFMLVDSEVYILNTAYFHVPGNKTLLAILNSKLIQFYISQIAADLGSEAKRYTKQYIEKIPIPQFYNPAIEFELGSLANNLLENHLHEDLEDIESKINKLVYRLYELTDNEINIIENNQS